MMDEQNQAQRVSNMRAGGQGNLGEDIMDTLVSLITQNMNNLERMTGQ